MCLINGVLDEADSGSGARLNVPEVSALKEATLRVVVATRSIEKLVRVCHYADWICLVIVAQGLAWILKVSRCELWCNTR